MSPRPNILFAIADDASHMSAYGHRFLSTPAFDRVAREGVLFTNAFTTNPKCAPSRASILTGRHTWQLEEACDHWNVWPAKFPVYPDLLAEAGYHVGYTGKPWAPGDWKRTGRSTNPAGPRYEGRTLTPPSTAISPKDYAGNFVDFLDARPGRSSSGSDDGDAGILGRHDSRVPFCFWYGGHEPHRPYERGEGAAHGKTVANAEVPGYLPREQVVQDDLADYAHEVEWFDRHLGLMLDELERRGELANTIVVVTSDNGMPFPRVKGQMYEPDFRLPLAAMWKAAGGGNVVLSDMISFTDFAPTFLEAAGLPSHPSMSGRSFLEQIRARESGRLDPHRDRVAMGRERHDLGREGDVGYPVRCLRTDEFLYVRNLKPELWPAGNPETGFTGCDSSPTKDLILAQHERGDEHYFELAFGKRPFEELYAIADDPECLHNLAEDPAYDETRHAMWTELSGYLRAQGDPRVFGGGDEFDTYEYVGQASHSWAAWVNGTWEPQSY
ncbi:MAG: sulfatase [Spirochaetota bacterium]